MRSTRHIAARLAALVFALLLAAPTATAAPAPRSAAQATTAAAKHVFTKKSDSAPKARSRGHINVKELAAKPHKAHKQMAKPRGVLPKPSGATTAPQATSIAPLVVAASTANAAPTPIQQPELPGLASGGPFTSFEPPDPWVAVGPDHVVQFVNTGVKIQNRQGVSSATDMSTFDFFFLPTNIPTFNSDGRVIYDSLHARWIASEVSWDCEPHDDFDGVSALGRGYLDFAISTTADPTGDWDLYYVPFNDSFPDQPAAGTSTDKVALTSNVFPFTDGTCGLGGLEGTEIDVMDWAKILGAAGLDTETDVDGFVSDASINTPRASVQVPATSAVIHGVLAFDDGAVGYFNIVGSQAAATDDINGVFDLSAVVDPFGDPPNPTQPTGTATTPNPTLTGGIDGRPTDAIWQGNRLVFVSTTSCTPTGDVGPHDCVRVTELNTANTAAVTKKQDFTVSTVGMDTFFGGIGLSLNGSLHVTYSKSGAAAPNWISGFTRYQRTSDAINTLSAEETGLLGATNQYSGERWGDYLGVAYDPQVPGAVWATYQAVKPETTLNAGGGWKTNVRQLSTDSGSTYVPITPKRVLDTRHAVGLSNAFTANVARSFAVTGGTTTVPTSAVAITGNVTVVGQSKSGFVAVTPRPVNKPQSSTLNFPLGDTRANNVTTPIGPGGKVSATYVATAGSTTNLLFDVTGYFVADPTGAGYNPITAVRVLDSRPGAGNVGGYTTKFASGVPRSFPIWGLGTPPIPATATAVTGNLTITGQNSGGDIAVGPVSTTTPTTSTLNYKLGDNRANGLTVKLSTDGKLWAVVHSIASARADLIFDVTGYYGPAADGLGLHYFSLNPSRIMDTRRTVLTGLTGAQQATASNGNRELVSGGHDGIPLEALAVTGNFTVTAPTKSGDIRIIKDAADAQTSTINFPVNDTRANGITVPLNANHGMRFVYHAVAGGLVHMILDITGYFR